MLLEFMTLVTDLVESIWAFSPGIIQVSMIMFTTILTTWTIWRLWRFTIQPLLRPHEPVELPYWIPCQCLIPV